MFTNWKEKLEKENNQRLFEIFSEKERVNLEPQIYSGNLLYDRNYDISELRKVKNCLVISLEDSFKNRYTLDRKKNKRENIIRELSLRILFAILMFSILHFAPEFEYNIGSLTLNMQIIAFTLILFNFLPLIWIKKSNEKSIRKAEAENEKKNELITKINTELRF